MSESLENKVNVEFEKNTFVDHSSFQKVCDENESTIIRKNDVT